MVTVTIFTFGPLLSITASARQDLFLNFGHLFKATAEQMSKRGTVGCGSPFGLSQGGSNADHVACLLRINTVHGNLVWQVDHLTNLKTVFVNVR